MAFAGTQPVLTQATSQLALSIKATFIPKPAACCCHIAAQACADYYYVKLVCHQPPCPAFSYSRWVYASASHTVFRRARWMPVPLRYGLFEGRTYRYWTVRYRRRWYRGSSPFKRPSGRQFSPPPSQPASVADDLQGVLIHTDTHGAESSSAISSTG